MIGIELVDERRRAEPTGARRSCASDALEQGMFILTAGPDFNIIRFIPPLVASIEEIDYGIDILDEALASYET